MGISCFNVIGPAMIGPSSSHTAGAVRIGLVANELSASKPVEARIELHGSFAATGKGHATDRAIVAGLLGWAPDDPRLKDSLTIAPGEGLKVSFEEIDLGDEVHPNTTRITVSYTNGTTHQMQASSVGGGSIEVTMIDGFNVGFNGDLETLLIWHEDRLGLLARVTTVLACVETNIASIRTTRKSRAAKALTVMEVDGQPDSSALDVIEKIGSVSQVRTIPRLP